ncbi:hypothetical protein DNTS_024240 [Danionella cerebrum]|uniref:PGC-1 and ERR-induced regulator in muscle protein 1 n=1 Tax=Danionella cerebrum TaxID=2873325 RepID=A0A553R362_9TELE|nr:hypothetical protein DNTS_024240 [Danionella translucida]
MEDFDYSFHISDQDWDGFFQECKGCDLLAPVLASREDSGMSDFDEKNCGFIDKTPAIYIPSTKPDLDFQIDGPPDSEGSPVCNYLSRYGICSPEPVLSGSEEDLHLQTVNLFFEQLKSITEKDQPLQKSQAVNRGSEVKGHLEGLIDQQDNLPVNTGPSGQNNTRETAKQNVANTWGNVTFEKPVYEVQEDASKSDSELVIARRSWLSPLVPARMKQGQSRQLCDSCRHLEVKPDKFNRKVMHSNPTRSNFGYLDALSSSDSKDSTVKQIPLSPCNLKRRRRKKKRASAEHVECDTQLYIPPSESEDERYSQQEVMNNLPATIWTSDQVSHSRLEIPSIAQNPDSQLRSMLDQESSLDFNLSKSLPVSLDSDAAFSAQKLEEKQLCSNAFPRGTHELNIEQTAGLSLPKIKNTLQESGSSISQYVQFDPGAHIGQNGTSHDPFLAPTDVHSVRGGLKKSKLPLKDDFVTDSIEQAHCLGSFGLSEGLPSLTVQNDKAKSRDNTTEEISAMKESCLSCKNGEESMLDGSDSETLICSPGALQETLTYVDPKTVKKNRNVPLGKTDDIDQGKAEAHIQSGNSTFSLNALPITRRISDDDGNEIEDNDNEVAAKDGQLSCEPQSSAENDPKKSLLECPPDNPADSTFTEWKRGAKDQESVSPDASVLVSSPVFALSSFWNEMEKLTINDILRLRLTNNSQYTSILTQPEDSGIVDTTDAGDSGYFTQLDDSKPDRLSGDMSYISDLDEDLPQIQSLFDSKQEMDLCESPAVRWENDSELVGKAEELVHVITETTLPEKIYAPNAQQSLRKMCKNLSVPNLQALDAQPIRPVFRNSSKHAIGSELEDDFTDPFYHVNTTSRVFSDDEEEGDTSSITFSEIIQFFFGGDEPERSRGDTMGDSHLEGACTSLPETYDHFFSEFDDGGFVCPIVEDSACDKMVPIFSCSRSASRNLQYPEAYDYFFPDSPGHSDDENDQVIKVVTRYDQKSPKYDPVDVYEHFLSEDESDFIWMNPLSFRRVRRTGFNLPENEACSTDFVPMKQSTKGILTPVSALCLDGSPFPDSVLLNLENHLVRQLNEHQKTCLEMQTVIPDPRLDAPFLPLKQADMCLVCIAFASWVLKSTALLANVSALSAIRYLRRHKKEEISGKTPLRQIEPA